MSSAISKQTARRLMLRKQLINPKQGKTSKNEIYKVIDQLGCIQIDTINVIERAQYMTLWSRIGNYEKSYLDSLAYEDRQLFEHIAHAASYIPFKDYRYFIEGMNIRKPTIEARFRKRTKQDPEIIQQVLKRIENEGPLSSTDFEGPKNRGGWWNWKPAKIALELLYGAGILLIDRRTNFQKYYDLAENVIPQNIDTSEPSEDERVRFFTLKTLSCLGLTKPAEIRQYYQHHSVKLGRITKQLQSLLDELCREGLVQKYEVEGEKVPYYCLVSNSDLLSNDDFDSESVDLFVYFDNFMWIRERIRTLFGFQPKLEVYLPKPERKFGYYHLPILYGDNLVGRLEPKLDRVNSEIIIRSIWYETGFKPDENFENAFSQRLESFKKFHGAQEIKWEFEKQE